MSCVCSHSEEEHGNDPDYPGSDECYGTFEDDGDEIPCECLGFEEDPES